MADRIKVKALLPFSFYVEGAGIIHGDPDSTLSEATNPEVPASAVEALVEGGFIAAPTGKKAKVEAVAEPAADAAP